ncbi:unnamed protein product [Somion occarium]|uniref:Uncharacterized protein n=1 Tax=Somion occarium TaxID=3059160 RepID=A0ABP1DL17_9APHY
MAPTIQNVCNNINQRPQLARPSGTTCDSTLTRFGSRLDISGHLCGLSLLFILLALQSRTNINLHRNSPLLFDIQTLRLLAISVPITALFILKRHVETDSGPERYVEPESDNLVLSRRHCLHLIQF